MQVKGGRPLGFGLVVLLAACPLMAQTINNIDVRQTEILDSDQIDIDGHYHHHYGPPPGPHSPAEKVADERRQQERINDDKTRKRLEDMRLQAEKEIGRRLNRSLDTHPGPAGAVVPPVPLVPGPVGPAEPSFFHQLRYTIYYGYTKYKSDFYDFNSKYRWGVSAEGNLNPNMSLGIYFNYASIDDLSLNYTDTGTYGGYNWGTLTPWPQFEQTVWSFGLFGKYYFQNWNAVRPYIYGGLGYNRITTKYFFTSGTNPYWRDTVYTQEEYASSTFTGQVAGGLQLDFSPAFGMFVQIGGIFSFASNRANYFNYEAARRGQALEDANGMDITIGASFKF